MASLNLSTNGPSISKSYQTVLSAQPSGPAASSPTYGQWAVFSVTAPLANAFQDSGNKESVLKVQSSGEGELVDLIDEFSDGRVQFAFVKVKDSNSGLPKNALIAWCGEGVPERTKGYFTSHMTAVAKLLHGYHVQITARSDRDLTPESIIQKVADASGSKYSSNDASAPAASATKPPVASKPVFTPTQSSGVPMRSARKIDTNVDEDGWGSDAPQVTRTQLEKVAPAYQPTKVNMRELAAQKPTAPAFNAPAQNDRPDVVRGAYQPIGKVDISEIRRQAKESGQLKDERPETVKGSYEPVGKVDIAAIRARAQKPDSVSSPEPTPQSSQQEEEYQPPSLAQRSAAFSSGPERLTSMPKPKVANKFGGGGAFTGTKAPTPGGFEAKPIASAAPIGAAGRTFADQGGKTPAQIWAEKKARERGISGSGSALPVSGHAGAPPSSEEKSPAGGWESGYAGKKWGAVSTDKTGKSNISEQRTGEAAPEEEPAASPAGGVGSIRDRFSGAVPMGAPAPPSTYDRAPPPPAPEPEASTKPNRGIPIPGMARAGVSQDNEEEEEEAEPEAETSAMPVPPPRHQRSPTPPTPEPSSPIRVAAPISKAAPVTDVHEDVHSPPPAMPIRSLAHAAPEPDADDEPEQGHDPGRFAAQAAAVSTMGREAVEQAPAAAVGGGERARAEFDYDAAEENEISLQEGEVVTDIQKLDPDWWLVTNSHGQQGLVPSNYLQLIEEDTEDPVPTFASTKTETRAVPAAVPAPVAEPAHEEAAGASATALYDYEAGEENEISFPEEAVITDISFPDEDWWHGTYKGKAGLFPAAYVELKQ